SAAGLFAAGKIGATSRSQSGWCKLEHTRARRGAGRCRGIDRDMRSYSLSERVDAQSSIHLCVGSGRGISGDVVLYWPGKRGQTGIGNFGGDTVWAVAIDCDGDSGASPDGCDGKRTAVSATAPETR